MRVFITMKCQTNHIKTFGQRSLVEERHVGRLQPLATCELEFYEILKTKLFEAQTGISGFIFSRRS